MQSFDQNIRSSFIYYFFSERPFDQKLWSSLIYFFYLHTTIRLNYMVLFHLFFLLRTTIRPKDMVLFHFFFFLLCTTIRPKILGHIDLLLLFTHNHSTKIYGPLSFSFFFCKRPVDQNTWSSFICSFFLHNYSTKN